MSGLPSFRELRATAERALDRWLPPTSVSPSLLHEAMRYAVLGQGKRIRPLLVYATGLALGVERSALDGPACAVELVHAYSLIHDDLPAMDNDDLRRGRPTCHRAFDEATAILAGDALQALAFHVLAHDDAIRV
ncbi:MAG: polyprenyl synthetase family protein, partial [Chloroflexi bacterium]|nr:polyprenyl synthetase family protein [Chloroflexota bacterium]